MHLLKDSPKFTAGVVCAIAIFVSWVVCMCMTEGNTTWLLVFVLEWLVCLLWLLYLRHEDAADTGF